jgi:Putative sensor
MSRLSLRRNPVSLLLSPAPWAAAWYLFSYLLAGSVLFAVVLTATTTAAVLCVTLLGLPLLVAAAAVVRGCAAVERGRLRVVCREQVRGGYRPVTQPGLIGELRSRWTDPALWRDLAYLLAMYPLLLALDATAVAIWLLVLAGITLPAWYRLPHQAIAIGVNGGSAGSAHGVELGYFPAGPNGRLAWGMHVDTLPKALLVAGACLVLFLLFNYALVAAARLHASIARGLLRAPEDPLQEAKEVLGRPGPLTAVSPVAVSRKT